MVDTALDLFKRRQAANRATVLIFYRGERSFFCKQWLRRWLSVPGFDRRLDLADVFLLFISSQSQGKAYSVADQIAGKKPILDTRVFFFGDPEHLLVDYLAESGLAHPVVTNPDSHRAHGWVFDYGMVQPAILALAADASVLYEWSSKPTLLNVAGKLDRPDPWDVWDRIEQRIDRIRITKARAARRAIAAGSSTVSVAKEGSAISSDNQSHSNTQSGLHATPILHRPAPKRAGLPNATQLSLDSLTSSKQQEVTMIARPESPVLTESPEKEPKSADEDREKSTQFPSPQGDGALSANDILCSAAVDRNLPKASSDGETTPAPPSTAIDTLTVDALKASLSREERDSSEDDMPNMGVQQLSASINALASEVLADKTLSLTQPEPETVAKLPKLAEEVVLSQHQAEPLTDEELEREIEDTAVNTNSAPVVDDTAKETQTDMIFSHQEATIMNENDLDSIEEEEVQQTPPQEKPIQQNLHAVHFAEPTSHTPVEDMTGSTMPEDRIESKDVIEPEGMIEPEGAIELDSGIASGNELDPDGRTEPKTPADRNTYPEDPAENVEVTKLDTSTSEDATGLADSTIEETPTAVATEAPTAIETSEPQDSVGDTLEASAASLGSDQVDSTAVIVKHPFPRAEDSTQINCLAGFDGSSFSSERRIPEEADDKKSGISDYLKELKDPSKLRDPRYRSRYDPLPPLKPPTRNSLTSTASNRSRPSSVSSYSYTLDGKPNAGVGLAQGLIQQETRMPVYNNRRDSGRSGRQSRVSQRVAPPVAVYVADKEPITPPYGSMSKMNEQSPEPMTASPHPEARNVSRGATVDISPFVDADFELVAPEEDNTKSTLRDEYEAYDEYIVCEYEVEEYVEEYESDAFSRSKVFVTTVVDDDSSQEGSMRTASQGEGETWNNVHQFDHCNVVDVKGSAREADPEGRGRVWKENGVRQTAPTATANETSTAYRQGGPQHMSPVQVLLHKMGIRGTWLGHGAEESVASEAAQNPGRDTARVSRKDTLRSVLRKNPRERVMQEETEESMQADEEEAKLGRKETIKSVLRKIPVPKNLKRTQTEVAINDEVEATRTSAPGEEGGARTSKRSGLQAVLQRLPSLSSANRHRGGLSGQMTSSTNPIKESGARKEGEQSTGDRTTATIIGSAPGDKTGVLRRTFSKLSHSEDLGINTGTGTGTGTGTQNRRQAVGEDSVVSGAADARGGGSAGGSGAGEGRKKVTFGDEGGEKLGAKMSFAVVGGRILSKFKM